MKKIRNYFLQAFLAALILILPGCSAFLPDNTEGALLITINSDTSKSVSSARTFFPDFSLLDTPQGKFIKYETEITAKTNGKTYLISSDSPEFQIHNSQIDTDFMYGGIIYGNYTITVKAYRTGETGNEYSAYGKKDFVLGPGNTMVDVSISPIIEENAYGTFKYKNYAGIAGLLPYSLFEPGIEDPLSNITVPLNINTINDEWNEEKILSGYYILYYMDNSGKIRMEIVNIYKNFVTELVI